jgi:hypothetical protein
MPTRWNQSLKLCTHIRCQELVLREIENGMGSNLRVPYILNYYYVFKPRAPATIRPTKMTGTPGTPGPSRLLKLLIFGN